MSQYGLFSGNTPSLAPRERAYNLVSTVAYLIGVRREMFERDTLMMPVFDSLDTKESAKIIRSLCRIRNAMMKYYDRIAGRMLYEMLGLDQVTDYIDPECIEFLEEAGIHLIQYNRKPIQYIADVNQYIADHIQNCEAFFPLWIRWEYIRRLFIMPNGHREADIELERKNYKAHINDYPFHCYINWPLTETGNILYHDAKFADLLYRANDDLFAEHDEVQDASRNSQEKLHLFIAAHPHIVPVVDCENSDPCRLCAVLRNIENHCGDSIQHIEKIILYDDPHTSDAWKILSCFIQAPIQYEMVERVSDRKSLVDIRMTAGACREHYQNNIDAFLLVSSDSDYWGLISALPNAHFLLLVEREKFGAGMLNAVEKSGLAYCYMEDFAGNTADVKVAALTAEMHRYLDGVLHLNVREMMEQIYKTTRLNMSETEKRTFFDKHVQTLRLHIDSDGNCSIRMDC